MTTRSADKTTEVLEKRLRKTPDSRLFSRLADAHRKEGNINRAIELCTDGIKKHPDYVTGHLILGRCFFEQQNLNGAFDEFKKVCTIDRHNQIAIKMLADIFVHQKMDKKAGSLYSILNKMDPYNKSLEKLASQFPSDGFSELYDILEINLSAEQIVWEPTSAEHQIINEQVAYGSGMDSDNFGENISPLQQSVDDAQQFPSDFSADRMDLNQINESTIAIDADVIDKQLNMLFDENPGQIDDVGPIIQENEVDKQDQILLSDNDSDDSTDTALNENSDVTGQDISSRIDELFSEKTDTFNNSTFKKMPELISEDDSPSTEPQLLEKNDNLDLSPISSELSALQSLSDLDLQTNPQPDLILEQPSSFDNLDPFVAGNVSSEFEETMQFERSFLDNVIDLDEPVENQNFADKADPFNNQDLISEVSGAQEISMDPSTSDAFDPSQIIGDSNQHDDIAEFKTQMSDLIDSLDSTNMASEENKLPPQEQSIDFEKLNLSDNPDSIDELPGVDILNQDLLLDTPHSPPDTLQSTLDTSDHTLPDLIDQNENPADSSPFQENNDLLFSDIQQDYSEHPVSDLNSDLIDSLAIPDSGLSDQENVFSDIITDDNSFSEIQPELTPDLPIIPQEADTAPDEFLSLAGENDILIDSIVKPADSDFEQLRDSIMVEESSESLPDALMQPELDQLEVPQSVEHSISTEADTDSDELFQLSNDQDNLAVIDADSEIDQLSVEHGDDVLTDMDVLVSDEVLNSVSGDDIVEKMEMLFPDEKKSSELNQSEILSAAQEPILQSDDLQVQDSISVQDNTINCLTKDFLSEDSSESGPQPSDALPKQQPAVNDEISIDIISNESVNQFTVNEDNQDSPSIISGQDVMDRLDQFFQGNDLLNGSSEMSDTSEENEELADFYTIFGDNAENAEPLQDLEGLDQVELALSEDSDKVVSFYDEWNDVCSLQDQNENDSFKEKIQKQEASAKQSITVDHQKNSEPDNTNRPYTIPDHVLTPTLADIYFQQGQPDLAIQIYTRLLSRDPDNENLQQKLSQLKESIDSGFINTDSPDNVAPDKAGSADLTAKKRKIAVDNRPLAGVRIKKRRSSGPNRSKNN